VVTVAKLKLYVSGPMTGLPEFNFPAFDAMSEFIEQRGMEAISPADHDRRVLAQNFGAGRTPFAFVHDVPGYAEGDVERYSKHTGAVHDLLVWDIAQIVEADGIVLLPGWENSTGAAHERYVAEVTNKRIFIGTFDEDGTVAGFSIDDEHVRLSARPKYAQKIEDAGGGVSSVDYASSHLDELAERDAINVASWPVPVSELTGGEVRVVNETTGGEKGSKLARFDLIPGDTLWELAEHYGRGSQKYADRNWQRGYNWSLSFAALMRHAWSFWNGEDIDPETGSKHMVAVMWHATALAWFMDNYREGDDRFVAVAA
jgi:hypothetical protein